MNITINEAEYDLPNNEKGKIAVFIYDGDGDPAKALERAIKIYVDGNHHYEFLDFQMDKPWMRVIISNINDMEERVFDPKIDRMLN